MRKPNAAVLENARQWVSKAENDLIVAEHALNMEEDCPTDSVCFHAQQCAEKYIKALLVCRLIDFAKTHDLNALARLLPESIIDILTDKELRRLTDYATTTRYPGDYEEISLAEAKRAVRASRRMRAAIRKLLPKTTKAR